MNSQYENTVFTTYIILWGIVGVVGFFLSRKAKSIEEKKRIDTFGFVAIAGLMLGVAILLHLPAPGVGILIIAFCVFFFLTRKYTFYCPNCLKKTPHLFTTLEYCPKCGQGTISGGKK